MRPLARAPYWIFPKRLFLISVQSCFSFVPHSKTKGKDTLLVRGCCSSNCMVRINLIKSFYLGRSSRRKGQRWNRHQAGWWFACWRSRWKFGWQLWKMGDKEKVTDMGMVGGKGEPTSITWQTESSRVKTLKELFPSCFRQFAILPVTDCPMNGIDYFPFFFYPNQL